MYVERFQWPFPHCLLALTKLCKVEIQFEMNKAYQSIVIQYSITKIIFLMIKYAVCLFDASLQNQKVNMNCINNLWRVVESVTYLLELGKNLVEFL